MKTAVVGLIIGLAAAGSFLLAGRGRSGWWIFALSLLLGAVGIGGLWLNEKGTQTAFAHSPVSITHLMWILSTLVLLALGGIGGVLVRAGVGLVRKR